MSSSTLVLLAYIFVLAPGMLLGFYFARTKRFSPQHKLTMTGITVLNWILIIALMIVSYSNFVLPAFSRLTSDVFVWLPTLHLLTGTIAQLLATYLVLLMWTEKTSFERIVVYRIKNIKTPMRLTLALWLITILLGVGIYLTWNAPSSNDSQQTPAATEIAPEATEASAESTEDAPVAPEATEASDESTEDAPVAPEATESSGG
jgi:hypothetical protein